MSRESVEERISAYLDGELSAAEKAEVERALASDPSLCHLHNELARMRQLLQSLPRATPAGSLRHSVRAAIGDSVSSGQPVKPATQPSANRHRPRRFWRWCAASTVAAAAALLLIFPWVQHAIEPGGRASREHASRESVEETRPERLRETESVAVPFAPDVDKDADVDRSSAEDAATGGMAGVGDTSMGDDAVAGGGGLGGGGFGYGTGPGGLVGSLEDKRELAEGLARRSHPVTSEPASIERLLDTLTREGTIELVGTMPVEVAARMKQTSGRRSMAEAPRPQSRPLATPTAADGRKKNQKLSQDSMPQATHPRPKNGAAGLATGSKKLSQPESKAADTAAAKPAAGMTRARSEPLAVLEQGRTESAGGSMPMMVIRGTRQEIASQLQWLLRQPGVELSATATPSRPAAGSVAERRKRMAPDNAGPAVARDAGPAVGLGDGSGDRKGKADSGRTLKQPRTDQPADKAETLKFEALEKHRREQRSEAPAENQHRRRQRLRIRLELVGEK